MDRPLAMAWAGFMPGDQAIEAAIRMNWAENVQDITEALKLTDGLAASFVFATVKRIGELIGRR